MNENQDSVDNAEIVRLLHFVLDKYPYPNKCRPAMVVEDWPGRWPSGLVNLVVFPDGTNDGPYGVDDHRHYHNNEHTDRANTSLLIRWETSVLPNHSIKAVRSWHWPRECKNLHEPAEVFIDEFTKERYYHNHADGLEDLHNCVGCIAKAKFVKENIPT